ncbi:hypothetical protein WH47_07397 [Habropoda laboriosa]|uniref:Uncharacterized protein n=1 Tax=Habropoda laboriosa TaxID=597456 RepID=A0A0L7R644_9HYME|nr:hypothetical protein WH47_07397 [Habropoda laboriosa]
MSERKVDTEIVRKQYTNDASLIGEAEIIDVSAFNFDDTDGWLYIPTECQTESTVHNLYTWLKSEPELSLSANRKFIDTRTFTRSKKRSSRTSFESILESLSSPVSNLWKTSNFSNIEEDFSKYSDISTANKEEAVPPMLKMVPNANVSLLADEAAMSSGQESMEVFLNMSHSKGIDSFINLMEPGLSDPLMNVSQPSIFFSSITSLPRDDSLHNAEYNTDEEPANLTHLCSQGIDKRDDSKDLNINETFLKTDELDNNKSYCLSTANATCVNNYGAKEKELNETYNASAASTMVVLSSSDNHKSSTTNLSSTFVYNDDGNTKILQSGNNGKKKSCNLNTTYPPAAHKAENSLVLNTTYSAIDIENENNDATVTIKNDKQHDKDQISKVKEKNTVHNVSKNMAECSVLANSSFADTLNSTFRLSISLSNQSTPKNMELLNSTFRAANKHLNSNFKAPTSLRKELLSEIYKSGDHRLDSTFNHVAKEHQSVKSKKEGIDEVPSQNIKNDIPIENKYNTYKKESTVNKIKSHVEITDEAVACTQNFQDKRYYTFTKKANAHGGKTDMENAESVDNVDATFVKPLPKLQKRKQHIPRMLSKLPQFLQKSNPNLVSNSLKTVNMTGCTNASNFGYMKGSQPNIVRDVEKSLANKLYPLGKVKSGSEQRLLELNTGVGELQILGAGGSTESIESTQSAHSAPDLDDRLSTCSDCSHNSYITQPMNIEQLHQIVRMQEESLKQDATPQLNRRVLDNTWDDIKKDLPSPITKNGIDGCERDSPLSMDYVKTSSPILSPTRSSQSINTDVVKVENKTRLRQPTNWNTGNRPSNLMSAIPRPPSRIPAPRFVRPTVKNIQGDMKRGYI